MINTDSISRITYAQKRINDLVKERSLHDFCCQNNLSYTVMSKLALGRCSVTFKTIAQLCHLFPPIEWLFYIDEKLPYKPQVVSQWDITKESKFIKEHKNDYKKFSTLYNINNDVIYNLFVAGRTRPTASLLRTFCAETNPINFFIDSDDKIPIEENYIPNRGDIVNFNAKLYFVLSKKEMNENSFIACNITESDNGIDISQFLKNYKIQEYSITTVNYSKHNIFPINTEQKNITMNILNNIKKIFD